MNRATPVTRHGFKWWLRPGTSDLTSVNEVVGRRAYFTREFQPAAGEHWLDGGANIGAFSVLVGAITNVRAYEPHPANAALARRNVLTNGSLARIHEAAIGAEAGHAHLAATTEYAQWRHSLLLEGVGVDVTVEAFADAARGCDCVKLDIEGSEIELLQAADLTGLRKLVFEWHFDRERDTNVYLGVVERLHSQFARVSYRDVPPDTQYDWFPPAAIVRCW